MPPRRRGSKAHYPEEYLAFRQRLVRARELAGLTQRAVALQLGRSQSFVAKSESGERRVDVIELVEFARLYRRSLGYFIPRSSSTSASR